MHFCFEYSWNQHEFVLKQTPSPYLHMILFSSAILFDFTQLHSTICHYAWLYSKIFYYSNLHECTHWSCLTLLTTWFSSALLVSTQHVIFSDLQNSNKPVGLIHSSEFDYLLPQAKLVYPLNSISTKHTYRVYTPLHMQIYSIKLSTWRFSTLLFTLTLFWLHSFLHDFMLNSIWTFSDTHRFNLLSRLDYTQFVPQGSYST